ncbi:MAG: hypothetical protein SCH71_05485 [Desulfobulbaceae bacterium]|nr:hypothetical protein [Desulfobulbaceae bacterium]
MVIPGTLTRVFDDRQLGWSPISDLIVEKVGNLLEIDLKDILIGLEKK